MNILIVEDEKKAAEKLAVLIREYNHTFRIVAVTDSVEDTVAWLRTHSPPDLLFLDIHLADGLSFEIFSASPVTCPVIFTTAYDAYALQAFRVNSIDYLLKPVTPQALAEGFRKYPDLRSSFQLNAASVDYAELLQAYKTGAAKYKSRFLVKSGPKIKTIETGEIAYFMAEDKSTYLLTHEQKSYIIDYTLDQLEELLHPEAFFRLNRKFLASIKSIREIHTYFKGRLHITLQPPTAHEIVMSNERAGTFKEWLDQ